MSAAIALMVGAAIGDTGVVLLGAKGLRRGGPQFSRWIRRGLAAILTGFGVWLLLGGLVP